MADLALKCLLLYIRNELSYYIQITAQNAQNLGWTLACLSVRKLELLVERKLELLAVYRKLELLVERKLELLVERRLELLVERKLELLVERKLELLAEPVLSHFTLVRLWFSR